MRNNLGQFKPGLRAANRLPVGTATIRRRKRRAVGGGEDVRAWVKVAEPNVWRLRAQLVWEEANGRPKPRNLGIHHKDEDSLNDTPDNLELVTHAEHLERHRGEYVDRASASWAEARREQRWSTKSTTGKRTGRHPKNCDCPLHAAA